MLAPWKKSYDKPRQHIKSRHITLPTKVHIAKAMIFPVVIYGCESWTIKKAEHWKTDAFELWCGRRFLRVLWKARRSNQSILKEVNPEYWKHWCWTWNFNTLVTWYQGPTHWRDPDAGKDWGQEKKGATEDEMVGWHQWFNGHDFEQTPGYSEGQGNLACYSPWGCNEWDKTEGLNKNSSNCKEKHAYENGE